jgi:tetratricopeptide (TPR) repeat protein
VESVDESPFGVANLDIGNFFASSEQYSEALLYFDQGYQIFRSLKYDTYVGYAAKSRASVLWQLGRPDDAKAALKEATSIAESGEGRNEPLLVDIYVVDALMELGAGNYRRCESGSRHVINLANDKYIEVTVLAKQTLGLMRVRTGATDSGTLLCQEAVELATSSGDPQLLAGARLALAEALMENGQASRALETALRAQEKMALFGKADSVWRAWLFAAEASRQLRDENGAREYAARALSRLSDFERQEGPQAYNGYLQRYDTGIFRKRLTQLLKPQK